MNVNNIDTLEALIEIEKANIDFLKIQKQSSKFDLYLFFYCGLYFSALSLYGFYFKNFLSICVIFSGYFCYRFFKTLNLMSKIENKLLFTKFNLVVKEKLRNLN